MGFWNISGYPADGYHSMEMSRWQQQHTMSASDIVTSSPHLIVVRANENDMKLCQRIDEGIAIS